jgi:hypothetical protein
MANGILIKQMGYESMEFLLFKGYLENMRISK